MGRVDALIAEVAIDLEDALESADERALEEELRRDAQVELQVQRVRARDEGARGGTALLRLQDRGLDLEEAALGEAAAHARLGDDAHARHLACLRAHDEIDVALADSVFLRQGLVRHRQRPQGLGGHAPFIGEDRELASLGGDHLARDEDVVADVDQLLPLLEGVLAHGRQREHGLELGSVASAKRGKAELAGVALEDHTPGHAHAVARRDVDVEVGVGLTDLGDGVRHGESDGVGLSATCQEAVALVTTDAHLLGQVVCRVLRVEIRHGRKGSQSAFLSNTRRRPTSVRSGSWWVIVSDSGTTMGARPPVAITAWTGPISSSMRRTSPST